MSEDCKGRNDYKCPSYNCNSIPHIFMRTFLVRNGTYTDYSLNQFQELVKRNKGSEIWKSPNNGGSFKEFCSCVPKEEQRGRIENE